MTQKVWDISQITPKEANQVYPVHAASFTINAVDFLTPDGFKAMASGPGATLLTVSKKGYILFRTIGAEAELLSLGVHPNSRNKGIGKALMQKMLKFLHESGVESLFLEVEITNIPAIGLYKTLGFDPQGTRLGYYGKKKDALVMKKHLH